MLLLPPPLLLLLPLVTPLFVVRALFFDSSVNGGQQGTDAMYNFVLKLNLATTEGKARFMKKWAIGRIANGETVSPREGWKFLQSLGIGVQKVIVGLWSFFLLPFASVPSLLNYFLLVFFPFVVAEEDLCW